MADGRPKEFVSGREKPSLWQEVVEGKQDPTGSLVFNWSSRHFASFQFSSTSLDGPGLKIINYNLNTFTALMEEWRVKHASLLLKTSPQV